MSFYVLALSFALHIHLTQNCVSVVASSSKELARQWIFASRQTPAGFIKSFKVNAHEILKGKTKSSGRVKNVQECVRIGGQARHSIK